MSIASVVVTCCDTETARRLQLEIEAMPGIESHGLAGCRLIATIESVPGTDTEEGMRQLEQLPGVDDVTPVPPAQRG